jgi:hypothetical protein
LTLPDVPPSVCYPSGRRRQRRGPKPGGQWSLDPRIGRERASRLGDCQHHGGRELAVRDMVNPGEVPIKAVIINKPKMLSSLDQKVRGQVLGAGQGACESQVVGCDEQLTVMRVNNLVKPRVAKVFERS